MPLIMSLKQTLFSNNNKPKTPKSPRSPTSPTIRQLLQAERTPNYLSNRILSPKQDEDQFDFQPNKKLSVIAKVKEKAKKWKQNLARKKPGQDGDPTPNWGVAYEEDEDFRRLRTPTTVYALRRSSSTYNERLRSSSYKEGLRSSSYKEGMRSSSYKDGMRSSSYKDGMRSSSYREGLRSSSYKEGIRERSMSSLSITEKHVLSYSVDRGYSEDCEKIVPKEDLSPSERVRSAGSDMRGLMPIRRTASDLKRQVYRDPSPEIKITPLEDDEEETSPGYEKVIQEPIVKHPASPPKSPKEGNAIAFVPHETVQDAELAPLASHTSIEKDAGSPQKSIEKDEEMILLASEKSIENDAKTSPLASPKSVEEDEESMPLASETSIEAGEDATKELNPSYLKLIAEEMGKAPNPSPEEGAFEQEKQETDSPMQRKNLADAVIEKLAPASSLKPEETESMTSEAQDMPFPKPLTVITTRKEAPVRSVVDDHDHSQENGISGDQKRDKGVSVKEYIKNKLEPGEDERALSQVISEAISPRRTPGDKGVMEKVKEAVTLLLLAEQKQLEQEGKQLQLHHHHHQQQQQHPPHEEQQEEQQRPTSVRHPSLSQIPVSTYPYEDELNGVEEESQGRILQAN